MGSWSIVSSSCVRKIIYKKSECWVCCGNHANTRPPPDGSASSSSRSSRSQQTAQWPSSSSCTGSSTTSRMGNPSSLTTQRRRGESTLVSSSSFSGCRSWCCWAGGSTSRCICSSVRGLCSNFTLCRSLRLPNRALSPADFFELALLLGSCFLVNYVTADAKTNWVEGLVMITFYFMIVCIPL